MEGKQVWDEDRSPHFRTSKGATGVALCHIQPSLEANPAARQPKQQQQQPASQPSSHIQITGRQAPFSLPLPVSALCISSNYVCMYVCMQRGMEGLG